LGLPPVDVGSGSCVTINAGHTARELDADAVALELADGLRALVAASAITVLSLGGGACAPRQPGRILHSHPAPAERVSMLMSLAREATCPVMTPASAAMPAPEQTYEAGA